MMRNCLVLGCLFVALGTSATISAGDLTGSVEVEKKFEVKRPPRYYKGPYRSNRGGGDRLDTGFHSVVIWIDGIQGDFSPPGEPAIMAQEGETFIPHVLPILAGTKVEFPNKDDFYHNVFSVVSGDRFDLGRYAGGHSGEEILKKPGIVVVRCEIHSGMKAFIVVLGNPYFAVPNEAGRFEIRDIPAGNYTLKAWHPTGGEREQPVTIPESGSVEIDFDF